MTLAGGRAAPAFKPEDLFSIDRNLGATEGLFHMLDKLYCLNFVVYAQVHGRFPTGPLNAALAVAQLEHPLLRAQIAGSGRQLAFRAVNPRQHPLRATVLPWRNCHATLERQLDMPFTDELPLARCLVFRDRSSTPAKHVVALVFHHAIADGRSGMRLLTDVLRRAGGERMTPDYRAAHPSAQMLDSRSKTSLLKQGLRAARFWLDEGVKALQPVELMPDFSRAVGAARSMRVLPMRISADDARKLVNACHKRGTTMHGALGAAQLLAYRDEIPGTDTVKLALNSLADLRGTLDGGLTERDLGLYIATLTTIHEIDTAPDLFWRLAVDLRSQLKDIIDSGDANLINSIYSESSLVLPTSVGARMLQGISALAPASSMLTNIGRVDSIALANGAHVSSVEFIVSPPPHSPFCITVTSYEGTLAMNLVFDESKLGSPRARRIRDDFLRHLHAATRGFRGNR